MQKEEILIIAIVVMAGAGLVIFLHFTNPEILTKTPREVLVGDRDKELQITREPVTADDCLVVSSPYCDSATFLLWTDGKLYKNAIFFLDIPVETKLYAPIGGYLHEISLKEHGGEGAYYHGLVIGEAARWADSGPVGRYVILTAKEFNLLDIGSKNGNLFVEKGQPFAEVSNSAELHPDIYEQGPQLIMSFSKEWADMIDDSLITDPREYIKRAIEKIN